MKNEFKGFQKIFLFTFSHQLRSTGYRAATILLAVLLFLLPAGIMAAVEWFGGDEPEASVYENPVRGVYIVDQTGTPAVGFEQLNTLGEPGYTELSYTLCENLEQAEQQARQSEDSVVLVLSQTEHGTKADLLLPEGSGLSKEDVSGLELFLQQNYQLIQLQKAGLTAEQAMQIVTPVQTEQVTETVTSPEGDSPFEMIKEVFSLILPFALIMILYFMVLFYGQSVANSVILEKNSKLMDTFLISVKPSAMIFGKVFAIVLASILQFFIWIAALAGGFAAGSALVRAINPQTDMLLLQFFDMMGELGGMFSPAGCIVAALILIAGFLLYCALASIGGSAAGKPEDLSSTNVLFTMILVISFLCTLYAGGISMAGDTASAAWMDWVPFTAILVTPGRLLLGELSPVQGLISLLVVLAFSCLVLFLAGKVYRMMALYKGNPPTPAKLFRMLRGK
ncbi:ABC-2 family transporter protein [uncultured Ruminococcus sp.]|uniref:ABC transporter permease n=1 Tax=Massiliimalia timonensis TaxID=1987501 RepID=UPI000822C0D3|nr:ABC transporter permease [Massiliimalia timonensis]SCG94193.1 ABC-2 family transporter protein [uncultured Clostridium sp.]SCH89952.1 ABC-2 family transporter protein [uncultured Ruminococcus sp.]